VCCLLQAKGVPVLAQAFYKYCCTVSLLIWMCDFMRRLVPRLEGRQKRRSWQSKLPSERLLPLTSSKGLQRKHFLRTLNLMTPQMMNLHHQTQTSFLPELLRTYLQCCSLISAAPCNIPYTALLVCTMCVWVFLSTAFCLYQRQPSHMFPS